MTNQLAPLLLDYFASAGNDDARDAAVAAIIEHFDSTPPSSIDELALMMKACLADPFLYEMVRDYIDNRDGN